MFGMLAFAAFAVLGLSSVADRLPRPSLIVVQSIGSTEEVSCLEPDETKLWVGLAGGGMIRWDGKRAERFDASDGLPGNRVNDCAMADGRLWVVTDSGLARFDRSASVFERVGAGRFLRVAGMGQGIAVAAADGRLLSVRCPDAGTGDGGQVACSTGLLAKDLPVAQSVAASPRGEWVVGGMDGRTVLSSGMVRRLDGPVLEVVLHSEGRIDALTPDSIHELVPGPLQSFARARRPGEHLGSGGATMVVPAPGQVLVTRTTSWGGAAAVGTDSGLYVTDAPRTDPKTRLTDAPRTDPKTRLTDAPRTDPKTRLTDAAGADLGLGVGPSLERVPLGGCPCGPRISSVEVFRGKLWAGGFDGGLCRLDSDGWSRFSGLDYLPSDMVNRLESTRRLLYVATLKGLVTVDTEGTFRRYVEADCVNNLRGACPWHQAVPGVALDPTDATVWVADAGAVHHIRGNRWKHYFRRAGIHSSEITRIAAGHELIVVATLDSGLLVKGRSDRTFSVLDERHGLADNWVMDVTIDGRGAVWAATCTRGVSRFQDGRWTTFTQRDGLADDYTLSVNEIDDRMWIGTLKGLTVLSETGPVSISTADGLAGDEVHDAVAQGDKVWLATDGGLSAVRYALSVSR